MHRGNLREEHSRGMDFAIYNIDDMGEWGNAINIYIKRICMKTNAQSIERYVF